MSITADDLIQVNHPGDALIWQDKAGTPPETEIINGEEIVITPEGQKILYWQNGEDSFKPLRKHYSSSNYRNLQLETTREAFIGGWIKADGYLNLYYKQKNSDGQIIDDRTGGNAVGYYVQNKKARRSWDDYH